MRMPWSKGGHRGWGLLESFTGQSNRACKGALQGAPWAHGRWCGSCCGRALSMTRAPHKHQPLHMQLTASASEHTRCSSELQCFCPGAELAHMYGWVQKIVATGKKACADSAIELHAASCRQILPNQTLTCNQTACHLSDIIASCEWMDSLPETD